MKKLLLGRSEDKLKLLPDDCIDAVITDPPYGLKFMNKKWDYAVPSVALWREVFRVLKPGGFLLSFGGTRTYHRMVVNIEDAGFEIRDCIQWIYGSGFPKSMDISKAFDKSLTMEREVIGSRVADDIRSGNFKNNESKSHIINITAPASDQAKQWEGWGTALKPANEPIVVARKPLIGTVVENIEAYGVGGINIDACRVASDPVKDKRDTGRVINRNIRKGDDGWGMQDKYADKVEVLKSNGRFPANVIFDEEAGRILDAQSGHTVSGSGNGAAIIGEYSNGSIPQMTRGTFVYRGDSGGASRFFYCAKASKAERNAGLGEIIAQKVNDGSYTVIDNPFQRGETLRQNTHPTVKPIKLIEYLIKLITPPDGIVLDPFAGSGTTGIACMKQGKHFVLIEQDEESYQIAKARLKAYLKKIK